MRRKAFFVGLFGIPIFFTTLCIASYIRPTTLDFICGDQLIADFRLRNGRIILSTLRFCYPMELSYLPRQGDWWEKSFTDSSTILVGRQKAVDAEWVEAYYEKRLVQTGVPFPSEEMSELVSRHQLRAAIANIAFHKTMRFWQLDSLGKGVPSVWKGGLFRTHASNRDPSPYTSVIFRGGCEKNTRNAFADRVKAES